MNPNANSFNPTGVSAGPPAAAEGGARQDSFKEYQNMVENIEQEMNNEETNDLVESMNDVGINSNSVPPSTTELPSHMKKHAAEFWFPESKDCTCCKGFKHGCQCSKSNNGSCSLCCGPIAATPAAATATATATAPPARVGGGGGGGNHKQVPCKFYRSPGGCRFGDNCRFAHF